MSNTDTLTNKGKGRPKGSLNKSTTLLREILEDRCFDLVDELINNYYNGDFDCHEKNRILFRLMDFVYPKMKEVELKSDEIEQQEKQVPVTVSITDLIKIAKT